MRIFVDKTIRAFFRNVHKLVHDEHAFVSTAVEIDDEARRIFHCIVFVVPVPVWLGLPEYYLAVREQLDLADPLGP